MLSYNHNQAERENKMQTLNSIHKDKSREIESRVFDKLKEIDERDMQALKLNLEIARNKGDKFYIKFIADQQATYERYAGYAQARRDALSIQPRLDEEIYSQFIEFNYQWSFNMNHADSMRRLLQEELVKINFLKAGVIS
jgi:hypothetical protein